MGLGSMYEDLVQNLVTEESEIKRSEVRNFLLGVVVFYIVTLIFFYLVLRLLFLHSIFLVLVAGISGFAFYNLVLLVSDPDVFKVYKVKTKRLFIALTVAYVGVVSALLFLS